MLNAGLAKKVAIHINGDTASGHDYLYKEILSFLLSQGVAGASLIRPEIGFGSHHHLHVADTQGVQGQHMPVQIEFIDSKELVDRLLPSLCDLVSDGLIEVQDTTIIKTAVKGAQY